MPTIYSLENDIPISLLPTPKTYRKPPLKRSLEINDEVKIFKVSDCIGNFEDINQSFCPLGFTSIFEPDKVIFYKLDRHTDFDIPEVSCSIVIDRDLHVKLFLKSSPIPLPEWFRKSSDRCIRKPPYIYHYKESKQINNNIISEDIKEGIKYEKPTAGPKFSSNLLRYALLLR